MKRIVSTLGAAALCATLVACSAGMSRSPALAAAAIARVESRDPNECLMECVEGGPADVSPLLWRDVVDALRSAE